MNEWNVATRVKVNNGTFISTCWEKEQSFSTLENTGCIHDSKVDLLFRNSWQIMDSKVCFCFYFRTVWCSIVVVGYPNISFFILSDAFCFLGLDIRLHWVFGLVVEEKLKVGWVGRRRKGSGWTGHSGRIWSKYI